MKKLKLGLLFILTACCNGYAQNFFVAEGLRFQVVNDSCVKVVPISDHMYYGNIIVPESVTMDGVTYHVTAIGQGAFESCNSLLSVQLPKSVTIVENSCFVNCVNLVNVVLPSNLKEIGGSVFYGCKKLAKITIPNSTKELGVNCFSGCKSLNSVTIGSGLETIEGGTFSHCTSLKSIRIPATVMTIKDGAFSNSSLKTVVFEGKNTKYTDYAFSSTPYFADHSQRSNSIRNEYEKITGRKIKATQVY